MGVVRRIFWSAMIVALLLGCSSKSGSSATPGGPDASSTDDGNGDAGNPATLRGPDGGIVTIATDGGGPLMGPTVGQVTGITTKLPTLPTLANVVGTLNDDSASVTFDPVDGALDYRIYPLPSDADINVASDGNVTVHDAIYRCAGTRESASPYVDSQPMIASDAINTQVDNVTVGGYVRTLADATLGYVYTQPGPGLVPVYALGESDPNADTTCFFARWATSRSKSYTTSTTERTQLLAAFARDDGIAFYVPAAADSTTTQVYVDVSQTPTRLYFPDGPEAAKHSSKTAAFSVLTKQVAGTQPLMRVFYSNVCGWSHDELAVGKERFNRAYKEGDALPWWSLLWTGVTGPTTLVVEALDSGCPYQGYLSPQSFPGQMAMLGSTPIIHQPWVTLDQMRASSASTEVFINGQYAATSAPKAVARSFVNVVPSPHAPMDFFADFSTQSTPETFTSVDCGVQGGNCYATWRQQSPTFDRMFIDVEDAPEAGTGLYAWGPMFGEMWVTYADIAADTNGKFRLTANQKATIGPSSFLHATMEVDMYSTQRRYPQILISDQDAPVQYNLAQGHTIIVQPRAVGDIAGDWPVEYELQVCYNRTWDVNNQCPVYALRTLLDSSGNVAHLAPVAELGESVSVDHRARFDIYTSTQRAYVFFEGQPFGCANLPPGFPAGQATVTWGDVLYHSAVDDTFAYHKAHMQVEQRRHFDNLGFSSGVPAPTWDESRLPCQAPITP